MWAHGKKMRGKRKSLGGECCQGLRWSFPSCIVPFWFFLILTFPFSHSGTHSFVHLLPLFWHCFSLQPVASRLSYWSVTCDDVLWYYGILCVCVCVFVSVGGFRAPQWDFQQSWWVSRVPNCLPWIGRVSGPLSPLKQEVGRKSDENELYWPRMLNEG